MSPEYWKLVGCYNGINPNFALPESGLVDPTGGYIRELLPHPFGTVHGLYLAVEEIPGYSSEWFSLEGNVLLAPPSTRELQAGFGVAPCCAQGEEVPQPL